MDIYKQRPYVECPANLQLSDNGRVRYLTWMLYQLKLQPFMILLLFVSENVTIEYCPYSLFYKDFRIQYM